MADYLERVAYNALPTQVTDDYSARHIPADQPDRRHPRVEEFSTRTTTPTCFSAADRLSLLHSNLHQGWHQIRPEPLVRDCRQRTRLPALRPSQVTARWQRNRGEPERGNAYPFEETVRYHVSFTDKKVKKVFFPFHLRIRAGASNRWSSSTQTADGRCLSPDRQRIIPGMERGRYPIPRTADEVTVSRWYENSAVVERGPLVYARKEREMGKEALESDKSDVYGNGITSDV